MKAIQDAIQQNQNIAKQLDSNENEKAQAKKQIVDASLTPPELNFDKKPQAPTAPAEVSPPQPAAPAKKESLPAEVKPASKEAAPAEPAAEKTAESAAEKSAEQPAKESAPAASTKVYIPEEDDWVIRI